MKTALFSTHKFEIGFFESINKSFGQQLTFFDASLNRKTALLAKDHDAVCAFVSDSLDKETLTQLKEQGIRLIALRSAGFNHVDLVAAEQLKLPVVRVPEYSPYAVAEHAVCLVLALNRKIHRAFNRVREFNFSLDGLIGYDLRGKTVGVIGTGKIGSVFSQIMRGFGCHILAYDLQPGNLEGVEYTTLDNLYKQSDVISLHIPLTPQTHHLINETSLSKFKPGAVLINTGRGALIDTPALINALKKESIGAAGLDVYEEEEGIFFQDLSEKIMQDDTLARLLTFPNVLITSHQAFLTSEALTKIAQITLQNLKDFESGKPLLNEVKAKKHYSKA